jgi:uncharacterized protein YabN with tetrapyrrole methylase and pyrophosphatase domain
MTDYFAEDLLQRLDETPALRSAYLAQKLSADVNFDFREISLVFAKVAEEHRELVEAYEDRNTDRQHFEEELGDNFFVLVNLCRWVGVDPEELLRANTRKYLVRCKFVEDRLKERGDLWNSVSLDEIYQLWKEAKLQGN